MRRLVLLALTAVLLTGCNGGSDDDKDSGKDATASASPKPTGPPCEGIWKAGETLPESYEKCVLDGVNPDQEVYKCTDGTKLVAFNDEMYAVTGGEIVKPKIQPFQDTEEYGKVYADCTGE